MKTVSPETLAQVLLWLAVLGGLIVVAVMVVGRFRGQSAEDRQDPASLLTKFQEMRQEGDISDTEYRTIKSVLGANLHREVKRGEDKI
jgi:uncharacterized membrane protein